MTEIYLIGYPEGKKIRAIRAVRSALLALNQPAPLKTVKNLVDPIDAGSVGRIQVDNDAGLEEALAALLSENVSYLVDPTPEELAEAMPAPEPDDEYDGPVTYEAAKVALVIVATHSGNSQLAMTQVQFMKNALSGETAEFMDEVLHILTDAFILKGTSAS